MDGDELDEADEEDEPEEDDPWPGRCEILAALLVAVVFCVLVQGIFVAVGLSFGTDTTITFADRLRQASVVLSPFDGVVLLVAAFLVALDGITTGDRRGPSTTVGRVASVGVIVLTVVIGLGAVARLIDVLAGHVNTGGFGPEPWSSRLGSAFGLLSSVLAALAAGGLALRTLDDRAWDWSLRRFRSDDEGFEEEGSYLDESDA